MGQLYNDWSLGILCQVIRLGQFDNWIQHNEDLQNLEGCDTSHCNTFFVFNIAILLKYSIWNTWGVIVK